MRDSELRPGSRLLQSFSVLFQQQLMAKARDKAAFSSRPRGASVLTTVAIQTADGFTDLVNIWVASQ